MTPPEWGLMRFPWLPSLAGQRLEVRSHDPVRAPALTRDELRRKLERGEEPHA